jgi:alpha-tubulin suppressor-like RCC1 family protein
VYAAPFSSKLSLVLGRAISTIILPGFALVDIASSHAAEQSSHAQANEPQIASDMLFANGFDPQASIAPTSISVGYFSACALMSDTGIRCWGDNGNGQLGNLSEGQVGIAHAIPVQNGPNDPLLGAAIVKMANFHACAIMIDGRVVCWGRNDRSQLGLGGSDNVAHMPTEVSGLLSTGETALELAVGKEHTCVLTSSMEIKCWGDNDQEQCGQVNPSLPFNSTIATPTLVDLGDAVPTHIVAGAYHACAVTNQGTMCWGVNSAGQLGRSIDPNAPWGMPGPAVPELADVQDLISGTGAEHVCAVDSNGSHQCWGRFESGQLGDGTSDYGALFEGRPTASALLNDPGFAPLAAGGLNGCGIHQGAVWCWGDGSYEQLTQGAPLYSAEPIVTSVTSGATDVAIGAGVVCAVVDDTVECWGINDAGILGRDLFCGDPDPNACTSPIPAPVHGLQ